MVSLKSGCIFEICQKVSENYWYIFWRYSGKMVIINFKKKLSFNNHVSCTFIINIDFL